jgi:hypothetical protein
MTRDEYAKATRLFDMEAKLIKLKNDLDREFPQFKYDPDYKEIGAEIYELIDRKLNATVQHIAII